MGSPRQFQVASNPCPLNALGPGGDGNFRATCDVTNKIDISKYFELMKKEYTTSPQLNRSRRTLERSVSSSTIEPLVMPTNSDSFAPLSPRRKKNAKKRISCDENSLLVFAAHNNMPKHSESYFNYDLSGQMMKTRHSENHHISKQKSWDLSNSKRKNWSEWPEEDSGDYDEASDLSEMSLSYSAGDFRNILNNNNNNNDDNNNKTETVKHYKSCDNLSSLGERHKEHAMMQGIIGSVSEENRRHRRKFYRKGKKLSEERPISISDDASGRINHLLEKKLVIDVLLQPQASLYPKVQAVS